MEPTEKETSSLVFPASVSVALRAIDWLWIHDLFLQPCYQTHLFLLHWSEGQWESKLESITWSLWPSLVSLIWNMSQKTSGCSFIPLGYWLLMTYLFICLPVHARFCGSKQTPNNKLHFSFCVYHWALCFMCAKGLCSSKRRRCILTLT